MPNEHPVTPWPCDIFYWARLRHFLVLIGDISKSLKWWQHVIYGDDVQILRSALANEVVELVSWVQEDVLSIVRWIQNNGIHLNIDKSNVTFIGGQFYVSSIYANLPPPPITDRSLAMQYVTSAKILGLTMSNTLSWTKCILRVSHRIHRSLHL